MIRRPPRSTRTDTLFPYTTLFRSLSALVGLIPRGVECEPAWVVRAIHVWVRCPLPCSRIRRGVGSSLPCGDLEKHFRLAGLPRLLRETQALGPGGVGLRIGPERRARASRRRPTGRASCRAGVCQYV